MKTRTATVGECTEWVKAQIRVSLRREDSYKLLYRGGKSDLETYMRRLAAERGERQGMRRLLDYLKQGELE